MIGLTLQELSQLYHLKREIKMDCQRLKELESTVLPGAQSISGMPKGGSDPRKLELYAVEISNLHTIIQEKQARCIQERKRLERYISNIPDSLTRQIFTRRFIDGLSWTQVAVSIGGGNTAGSVRVLCHRYLHRKSKL